MIKILAVDDHPVVRQGVRQIIGQTTDMIVADEASDGNEALSKVLENDYDLVLLDISMPGKSGTDIIAELKRLKPDLPILVLTIYPEKQFAVRMLKAGASGYLTKDKAPTELVEAIRKVSQGSQYIPPDLAERIVGYLHLDTEKLPHETLSRREYEIMVMIASGKTVKEIAEELYLSVKTVSTHRGNILRKMRMRKNIELVHYAIQNNLVDW